MDFNCYHHHTKYSRLLCLKYCVQQILCTVYMLCKYVSESYVPIFKSILSVKFQLKCVILLLLCAFDFSKHSKFSFTIPSKYYMSILFSLTHTHTLSHTQNCSVFRHSFVVAFIVHDDDDMILIWIGDIYFTFTSHVEFINSLIL